MRIVVAGGTGFLGAALVERLRGDGHDVTVLSRDPRHRGEVRWETSRTRALWWETIDGADAVVNLAGVPLDSGRWTEERKSAIRGSRIDSTQAIATAISHARTPPGVLLNASAVGIYGARGEEVLTVGSSRVDLQACKLEYSIVSPK